MQRNYQSSRPSPAATAAMQGSKITSEPLVPALPGSTSQHKRDLRRDSYVRAGCQAARRARLPCLRTCCQAHFFGGRNTADHHKRWVVCRSRRTYNARKENNCVSPTHVCPLLIMKYTIVYGESAFALSALMRRIQAPRNTKFQLHPARNRRWVCAAPAYMHER